MKKASKEPLVSIIIPVYNVEPYLVRCLDSVISQTYKNVEIIVVDDGSTDNSGKICDKYTKKDKRIKAIHKKNGGPGPSSARNRGIEEANGEYYTFIDSDDYVEKNFIATLVKTALADKTDIVICAHKTVYANNVIDSKNNKHEITNKNILFKKMLYSDPIVGVSPWAKLFKKELWSKIRFPEGMLFEDSAIIYKAYNESESASIIGDSLYNYFMREGSTVHESFDQRKLNLIDATKEMRIFIAKNYPELTKGANRRLAWAYLSTIAQATKAKDYQIAKKLISELKPLRKGVILDKQSPNRDKIALISTMGGAKTYAICWRLFEKLKDRKKIGRQHE